MHCQGAERGQGADGVDAKVVGVRIRYRNVRFEPDYPDFAGCKWGRALGADLKMWAGTAAVDCGCPARTEEVIFLVVRKERG